MDAIVGWFLLVYISAAILAWQYTRLLEWLREVCRPWWDTWMEVVIGDGLVVLTGLLLALIGGWPQSLWHWLACAAAPYVAWGGPVIWWQVSVRLTQRREQHRAKIADLERAARRPRLPEDTDG